MEKVGAPKIEIVLLLFYTLAPQSQVDLLFDQVMLSELKGTLDVLNSRVFSELRSYVDPPPIINQITKALLAVFDPEKSSGEWNNYKSVRFKTVSGSVLPITVYFCFSFRV